MGMLLLNGWILLCSILAASGWMLSALNLLDPKGYFIVLGVLLFVFGVLLVKNKSKLPAGKFILRKGFIRFRRAPAFLYLVVTVLIFLGGIIHDPIHGDTLGYRIPRIYHWLSESNWHWIHTDDIRMNVVALGTEWLWTPLLLFIDSHKPLVWINLISFLFLPGLIFSLFRLLGVRAKIAWWWMWLFPLGYCYALQAGGLATDGYSTIFALAAVVYALKALKTRNHSLLLLSVLAASFLTNTKQTNLLLIPLWFVPFILNYKLLFKKPVLTGATLLLALLVSCLPISIANIKYAGNWQGFRKDLGIVPVSPFWGIVGNAMAIPAQNLLPPVFPMADQWNAAMRRILASSWGEKFKGFETFGYLQRAPSEQNAGLGLTTTMLFLASLLAIRRKRGVPGKISFIDKWLRRSLLIFPWGLLLVFMAKVGVAQNARYLAPLYPFLVTGILYLSRDMHKKRWWRGLAYTSALVTVFLLITSRQRPLIPLEFACNTAEKLMPGKSFPQKVRNAYSFFPEWRNTLRSINAALPGDARLVAFVTPHGNYEPALWKPFGSRKVVRVTAEDIKEDKIPGGLTHILWDSEVSEAAGITNVVSWAESKRAPILRTWKIRTLPDLPPETIYLLKWNSSALP